MGQNHARRSAKIKTAMTVDCDVHHGNGTAAIFGIQNAAGSPRPKRLPYTRESPARDVFTISLHQENNYPAWKPPSSIDVGLPDSIGDDEYLTWLDRLPRQVGSHHKDVLILLAREFAGTRRGKRQ